MTVHTHPTATQASGAVEATPTTGPVARIVAGSLAAGAAAALVLTLVVFPGGTEGRITGSLLVGFGFGWALLAALTGRYTNRPQRWAAVPAAVMGATGLALLAFTPEQRRHDPAELGVAAGDAGARGVDVRRGCAARSPVAAAGCSPRSSVSWPSRRSAPPTRTSPWSATRTPTPPPARSTTSAATGCTWTATATAAPPSCSSTASARSPPPGPGSPARSPRPPGCAPTTAPDRAGATTPTTPRTASRPPEDLHTLLAAAGETGPYVLVGHSTGGTYAMNYAARYPEQVAGMVLLDSSSPEQLTRMPAYAGQYAVMRRGFALLPTLNRLGLGRAFPASSLPAPAADQVQALTSTARAARNGRDELSVVLDVFAQAQALTTLDDRPLAVLTASDNLNDRRLGRRPGPARRPVHQPRPPHRRVHPRRAARGRGTRGRVGPRHHRGRHLGSHRLAPGPEVTTPEVPAAHVESTPNSLLAFARYAQSRPGQLPRR